MSLWTGFPAGIGQGQTMQVSTQPRRPLKCQAKACDFERKLGHKFLVPDELLQDIDEDINEDSILLDMPYEVLLCIYDSVAHAPSQVALALTCKRLAVVAQHVHLHLSPCSAKYAGFLPKTVFDVPELMTQLKPWMPAELRLCNHCLTNRPQTDEYWATVVGCEVSNFWIQKTGWNFHNASWHKQIHDICPACHASCSLSDYVDCDGCRALGRLGDVDWSRLAGQGQGRPGPQIQTDHIVL